MSISSLYVKHDSISIVMCQNVKVKTLFIMFCTVRIIFLPSSILYYAPLPTHTLLCVFYCSDTSFIFLLFLNSNVRCLWTKVNLTTSPKICYTSNQVTFLYSQILINRDNNLLYILSKNVYFLGYFIFNCEI